MNARWYRVCVAYGSLVWLNLLFLVASLGIVTMPAALVALHDQTRGMAVSATPPTWRGFAASLRRLGIRGTAVLLIFAVPVLGAGVIVGTSPSAFAAGAALVLGAIAATFLSMAPYVITQGASDVRTCLVNVVAAVVLRPGTAMCAVLSWMLCAAAVAWLPVGFAFALYAVLVSLPAYLTCLIASRPSTRQATTARRRAAAQVLRPAGAREHHEVLVP